MNIQHEKLLEFVLSPGEFKNIILQTKLNPAVKITLTNCFDYCFILKNTTDDKYIFQIESVIDFLHDELNTGHWSEVPLQTRQHFTCASFLKCIILLKSEEISVDVLRRCLKCLDLGLLLGAPFDDSELLSKTASYLSTVLDGLHSHPDVNISLNNANNKRPLDNDCHEKFNSINAEKVQSKDCPSVEYFNNICFKPQIPVKLKGCMEHWPATRKWLDINYLLKIAANRTVPIEIGSHYVDADWSQKLMTFKDFIRKHYLSEDGDTGYLAQYNLFDQVTELRQDICIPEYCCLSLDYENATDPDINAWLGPKGTVSPLHFDPKSNILAQVYGTKQLVLFAPSDTKYLYPHETTMLSNTSQVDPLNHDLSKYPEQSKAKMFKCLLEPGEMLFIPAKWWHHVTALDKSFSVSFWWQ